MAEPRVVVLAGPSGAGKTTLANMVVRHGEGWYRAKNSTTRKPRTGNADEYEYLGLGEFLTGIKEGLYLEYAEVFGNYYGIKRSEVFRGGEQLYPGSPRHTLVIADSVGCASLMNTHPDWTFIAILPPSISTLGERLVGRDVENGATGEAHALALEARLRMVPMELNRMRGFDFAVVNNNLNVAYLELNRILGVVKDGHCHPDEQISRLIGGSHVW